ncbi:MAG: hypothetical protein GX288_03765 [Clostridiales bacterium]|mgnify:CR=1 FL=1|nr:hypothetical protein [Clostridiales bacterium]
MALIERDGSQYKPHFQYNDWENTLPPKFGDKGVVVFNVTEFSDTYLLEIKNNDSNDVAYLLAT